MNNIEKFCLFFCKPVDLGTGTNSISFKLKSTIKENLPGYDIKYVEILCCVPNDFSSIKFIAWLKINAVDTAIATTETKGEVTIDEIKDVLHELVEKVNEFLRERTYQNILANYD